MAQFDRMPPSAVARRWQDWANLILGIWLFISPWVLNFGVGRAPAVSGTNAASGGIIVASHASWNAWIFGVIVALVAISALSRLAPWQEWVNLLIGIWLFIAPWILSFAGEPAAAWDHWIIGVLVFLVSLSSLPYVRRQLGTDYAHAGDKPPDRP